MSVLDDGIMAGLAAAHELVERGFAVTVYERKALGGKARSIPVPQSAAGGRRPEFEPLKRIDAELFRAGLPNALDRP